MSKVRYKEWTRIPWDGNPDLKLECWRKSFGRGHVSVGIGEFLTVTFSFGANSDDSHSSTRWNYENCPIPEERMMHALDEAWEVNRHRFSTPKSLYNREGWMKNKLGALLECGSFLLEAVEEAVFPLGTEKGWQ